MFDWLHYVFYDIMRSIFSRADVANNDSMKQLSVMSSDRFAIKVKDAEKSKMTKTITVFRCKHSSTVV